MAEAAQAIRTLIEFYFGDANFAKDKFMKTECAKNKDGYLSIETLLKFNKLKAITTDVPTILAAIAGSEVVSVSPDGLMIKRVCDLPVDDSSRARTLYVKGYPIDDAEVTIESVVEQWKTYGKILLVKMRSDRVTKKFKGSCFIEYEKEESVAAAVAASYGEQKADSKDKEVTAVYKGQPFLCVMFFTEWKQRKEAKQLKWAESKKKGTKRSAGDGDAAEGEKAESGDEPSKKKAKKEEGGEAAPPKEIEFTKGLVVKVSSLPEGATMFQIKDTFKALGEVRYVEFSEGSTEAVVRLTDLASAEKIMTALGSADGVKVLTHEDKGKISGVLMVDEEEKAYWAKIQAESLKKGAGGKGGKGGRGGGRGGRGGGRGGRGRGGGGRGRGGKR